MTTSERAAFEVKDCALITLSLGRSAQTLRELRAWVSEVPAQSLYHHFYETLLRPGFDDPEYRNDFALWADHRLRDVTLAERLAMVDPLELGDLEELRGRLVDILEERLAELHEVPAAEPGLEFQFLRSQVVVFDTGLRAETPAELADLLPRLSTSSVFFHFVEARRRSPKLADDFSTWLASWGDETAQVRSRLAGIDVQLWSLIEMRAQIAAAFGPDDRPRGSA